MEEIARLIKEKGQRLTSQKREVLRVLHQKPQTVLEILNTVKSKKNTIDKATVYRILTSLVRLEVVREIHLGDRETRYELANCGHHHHLVCENCGDIEDIELCEDALLKEARKHSSFKIKRHSLEFFGTCKKCQ
ncbi:MAG: Fur family transcriptional regulator [bacterium]